MMDPKLKEKILQMVRSKDVEMICLGLTLATENMKTYSDFSIIRLTIILNDATRSIPFKDELWRNFINKGIGLIAKDLLKE